MISFTEKIAIGYTCCGPTYRKSALDKLENHYYDHPNLYYCILTDDKSYFKDCKRQNLVVNELRDFYPYFPYLEKYEAFLESESAEDYGQKFVAANYKFPFATYRFNLLQAMNFGVTNVALLGTDSTLNLDFLTDELLSKKNIMYNFVSAWYEEVERDRIKVVVDMVKKRYDLEVVDKEVLVFDEAARLYVLRSTVFMNYFLRMWDDIVSTLYIENKTHFHVGSYAMHDEFLLAVIYNVIGIYPPESLSINHNIFDVRHNPKEERFWT